MGVLVVGAVTISGATVGSLLPGLPQAVKDLNVGVIALVANALVMFAVSAATRTSVSEAPAKTAPKVGAV